MLSETEYVKQSFYLNVDRISSENVNRVHSLSDFGAKKWNK